MAVGLMMVCVGCSNSGLARQMVTAPNRRLSPSPDTTAADLKDGRFSVHVGGTEDQEGATIAGWVIEPKLPAEKSPRGTVFVLHGFLASHIQVHSVGEDLAKEGYRAVLIDLRGHGKSTGKHITYGVMESHDLLAVLDYLQKKNLAGDAVGVYGVSLGAAVAIQWAAIDPRVKVIVAVAPFATLKDEAPYFGKTLLPFPGAFLSSSDIAAILARAGEIAHFDTNAASPLDAITKTKARILLIHGRGDRIIPVENSQRLHASAPDSQLQLLDLHGHLAVSFNWFGDIAKMAVDFFDKNLAPATR